MYYITYPVPFITYNSFKRMKFSAVEKWLDQNLIYQIDYDEIIYFLKYLVITLMIDNKIKRNYRK